MTVSSYWRGSHIYLISNLTSKNLTLLWCYGAHLEPPWSRPPIFHVISGSLVCWLAALMTCLLLLANSPTRSLHLLPHSFLFWHYLYHSSFMPTACRCHNISPPLTHTHIHTPHTRTHHTHTQPSNWYVLSCRLHTIFPQLLFKPSNHAWCIGLRLSPVLNYQELILLALWC